MGQTVDFDPVSMFRPLVKAWQKRLRLAMEVRKEEFDEDAKEVMDFFDGKQSELWEEYVTNVRKGMIPVGEQVSAKYTIVPNRVFEAVKLLAPRLVPNTPHREVTARRTPPVSPAQFGNLLDPVTAQAHQMYLAMKDEEHQRKQDAAQALKSLLNYTVTELNCSDDQRRCIEESIAVGMGVLWTELANEPGLSTKMIGSFYMSPLDLLVDSDATVWNEIGWAARKRCEHVADVEQRFGLSPGYLRKSGHFRSSGQQGNDETDDNYQSRKRYGEHNDIITYYEVYSKVGLGGRYVQNDKIRPVIEAFGDFGDYVYLAVCDKCPYFLNLTPEHLQKYTPQEMFDALSWPAQFYKDRNGWPFEAFAYNWKPGKLWPISHIKPGLAELKAISILMSILVTKAEAASTTYIGVAKAALEDVEKSLFKSENGFSIIPLNITVAPNQKLSDLIDFMQPPEFNKALMDVILILGQQLELRFGLLPILYGAEGENQARVAADINTRQANAGSRIDDMYRIATKALSRVARKEAAATKELLTAEDLVPCIGRDLAGVWQREFSNADLDSIYRDYEYAIEAGDEPSLSKQGKLEALQKAWQYAAPVLQQILAMNGDTGPLNNMLQDMMREAGVAEPERYQIAPLPPPMPPAPPQGEGNPDEQGQGQEQPQQQPPQADMAAMLGLPMQGVA